MTRALCRVGLASVFAWFIGVSSIQAQQAVVSPPAAPPASTQPAAEPMVVSVPYQQTMTIQVPGATRVLSVNPDIVEAALQSPGIIELRAVAFGQTFLHIWTPSGRTTRALEVVQPVINRPTRAQEQEAADARAKHLTFGYQNLFRTNRRGPTLGDMGLNTTTQFTHDLTGQMETPHGDLSGHVGFQRLNSASELSAYTAALTDGKFGPLRRFDVVGGDTSVGFSDLSLPAGAVRGADVRYYALEPYVAEAFYGRRRLGFAPGLSPDAQAQDDFFLSGGGIRDDQRPWTWGVGYAGGSGQDRIETQTSQAFEANSWYWPSETFGVGAELGRNQENVYGYRVKSALRGGGFNMDAVYRNLSQRYKNLLGTSPEQGERGLLLTSQWIPMRPIRLRQRLDFYKDTLFLNPDEPDAINFDLEWGGDVDLTPQTVLSSSYNRQKLLGRLFPSDATSISTSLRQRIGHFPLLSQGSVFTEHVYRDLRSVSSPESDFHSHTVRAGVGAPLTETLSWEAAQQWTFLREELSGADNIPRETTAGIHYFQRFHVLPVSLRGGFNYSIASNAESANSFLSNEERMAWDAGLRYYVSPDLEAFVDSRLLRRHRTAANEFEFNLETGVRYFFDTGLSWEPSAKISGIVFQDLNGDGKQQPGEAGLPKVAVTGTGERTALTDAGGRFYLGTLRGTRAKVAVDLSTTPQGLVPTLPTALVIDLAAPPRGPLYFGFIAQAELRVRVFVDVTGNGQYDATDVPLENIHLTLQDGTSVQTDRSGWAFFRALRAGEYQVKLAVDDLAAGNVPVTALTQTVTAAEGHPTIVDVPIRAERSIGGRVYVDLNRNAHYEGEPALPDVFICLDGSRRVKTLEDGRYLFKGVSGGVHRVRLNCGARLHGYLPLNATLQTVELPAQAMQLDSVDFRLGEEAAMLQDVTADVLRERQAREALINEMIRRRKAQQDQANPPAPEERTKKPPSP